MAEKGWLREHAVKTAVGVVVTAIVGAIITFTVYHFHGWILVVWHGIKKLFHWLGEPVNLARWFYWLLVGIAGIVTIKFLRRIFSKSGSVPVRYFTSYTQDNFFGLTWRWQWTSGGLIDAGTLTAFCSMCDRRLPMIRYPYATTTTFHCDACGDDTELQGNLGHTLNRVLREIDLKARKGTWPDNVTNP
jgi:hypothetical protein